MATHQERHNTVDAMQLELGNMRAQEERFENTESDGGRLETEGQDTPSTCIQIENTHDQGPINLEESKGLQ